MFDFLVYLGQSALCLAALYLIYKVAMSHETLHIFNRVVLLGSIILSALLPLCRVKIVKEYDVIPTVKTIEVDDMVVMENIPELGVDYVSLFKDIAVALFAIGFFFMLLRLAVSVYSVWRLIHSGRMSVIEEDVTLTIVSKLSTPFSWFGHIVASEEDMREYRDMILSHELAHIRLRHSWDVLFADLALCLWWFNPAMWLLRREMQSLHEYQADEAVINNGVDAKNYQMLLIKRAAGARLHSVANCLNHSNLKNRITMMCKKTSSRWAATKALLVLPVVAISLSAFATTVYVPREVQDKVTENFANEQIDEKTDPVYVVDGKVIPNEDVNKIDPTTIKSVNVFKSYKEEFSNYDITEEQAENGVVVIELKKEGDTDVLNGRMIVFSKPQGEEQPSVMIDTAEENVKIKVNGEYVPYETLKTIPSESIEKMEVNKQDDIKFIYIETKGDVNAEQGETKSADIRVIGYSTHEKASVEVQQPEQNIMLGLREALQINLRGVNNLYGVIEARGVLNKDKSFSKLTISRSAKEENKDLGPLINEVSRALQAAANKIEVKNKIWFNYEISFCVKTDDGVLSSKVPVGSDAIVVMSYAAGDMPFIKVEKMPTFQGGDLNAFRNWMQAQIQYPAEAAAKGISGRVIFEFVVEKDGSTSSFKVLKSPDALLSAEVERIFKTSPKWEAGTQRGEKVRVKYTVPIVFNMQGAEEKKTELVVANEILAINNSEPYIKVEKMPTFQGGDLNAYRNWFQSQIKYPAEAAEKGLSGRVIFSFVVEIDGSSSNFTIMASPDKLLSTEVERVFKTSPKWEAGTQGGKKVRVKYTVPIVFKMQGSADDGLKIIGTRSEPRTPETIAATEEFKKSADIVIKVDGDKETYIVNGNEVKKEEVGAYEPEKVVVEGAGTDGVKYVYIKKK